ncbi:disease resistance-like protein DSC1 [Hevea brasiliensis]|uniref:disease resistance-like protein DSC1 n=1 Tax=Hevea brasiliensis TaxID=3981 RepID=UPI0025DD22E8|nr:disease resistance-like protein DSC1 [Hevea brasiliensis]
MGKDIVGEEKEIGKRSRLCNSKDIYKVLTKDVATERVEGISANMSEIRYMELSSTAFKLEVLDFEGRTKLVEIPLSKGCLCQLRELQLKSCMSLKSIPSSIGESKFLHELDFGGCSKLASLPDTICNLKSLTTLKVSGCVNLNGLPENLGNLESLKWLCADESGITKLPSSKNQLRHLEALDCSRCKGLILPSLTGLSRLGYLTLNNCQMLQLHDSLGSLTSLETINLRGNNIEFIPESIKQLSMLRKLDLRDCKRLKYLPELSLSSLINLYASNCTSLESASIVFPLPENNHWFRHLYFSNSISLDEGACRKIIENVLAANHLRPNYGGARLQIAGSEAPQRIRYQNKRGSSLSFSLDRHDLMGLSFFAVLEPKIHPSIVYTKIGCMALFTSESGCSRHDKFYMSWYDYQLKFQSENVFLWRSSISLDSNECFSKASFQFFTEYYDNDGADKVRSEDVIVKCGVHPIFKHKRGKIEMRGTRKSNQLSFKD